MNIYVDIRKACMDLPIELLIMYLSSLRKEDNFQNIILIKKLSDFAIRENDLSVIELANNMIQSLFCRSNIRSAIAYRMEKLVVKLEDGKKTTGT